MCDCAKKDGFRAKLAQADFLTKKEGETHVVYHMDAVDEFFIVKESDITDEMEICCYFRPNGKKHGEKVEYQKTGNAAKATATAKKPTRKKVVKVKILDPTTDVPATATETANEAKPEEEKPEVSNPEKDEE